MAAGGMRSEVELQPRLDNARGGGRVDHAEVQGVAYVGVGIAQVHVIESIKHFNPELESSLLIEVEVLEEGEIKVN